MIVAADLPSAAKPLGSHKFQLLFVVFCSLVASRCWNGLVASPPSGDQAQTLAEVRALLEENQQLLRSLGPDAPAMRCGIPGDESGAAKQAVAAPEGLLGALMRWAGILAVAVAFLSPVALQARQELKAFRDLVSQRPEMREQLWWYLVYKLDLWVSMHPNWREIFLMIISIVVVVFGGIMYCFVTGQGVCQSMTAAWLFMVDTGAHAEIHDRGEWFLALMLTICGMVITALLISIATERLQEYLERMHAGRSSIYCSGHVLILGWSDKIVTIIEELAEANASEGGGMVVILSDGDKRSMETELQFRLDSSSSIQHGKGLRGTQWAVRSGNPMLLPDLKMVAVQLAKSVIILRDCSVSSNSADQKTVRILLGLSSLFDLRRSSVRPDEGPDGRRGGKEGSKDSIDSSHLGAAMLRLGSSRTMLEVEAHDKLNSKQHIVVELADAENIALVHVLGNRKTEVIVAHEMSGQLLVRGSRQEGLAQVFEQLVGFTGSEFYIKQWPELVGRPFCDVAFSFGTAIPIGVVNHNGTIDLNPPDDYCIKRNDRIVVLAEDDSDYSVSESPHFCYTDGTHGPPPLPERSLPEDILICGWQKDLGDMVFELETTVHYGSTLTVISPVPQIEREIWLKERCLDLQVSLTHIRVIHRVGDPTNRRDLETLPIEKYDSVIVTTQEDLEQQANAMLADGQAVATVLLILDIGRTRIRKKSNPVRLTTELRDYRTRHLIKATGLSDYIMSQSIIASIMANVAETREVNEVMREILTSSGNTVCLRPVEKYLHSSTEKVCWWDLTARVRQRRQILIGYRGCAGHFVLNPTDRDTVYLWEHCSLILVAECLEAGDTDEESAMRQRLRSRVWSSG
mmetsp:Transcript_32094/g.70212  ORF Transcript_32094/g.70212 Transcript_32094/m.70212 type:complete len:857 (-) Transcript_32094:504-3074(-)